MTDQRRQTRNASVTANVQCWPDLGNSHVMGCDIHASPSTRRGVDDFWQAVHLSLVDPQHRFFALGVAISRRERHVAGPSAHNSCHCCLVSSALRAALQCAASVEVPFLARTRAVLLAHACVFEKSSCSSKCHSCYKLASRIQSLLEQYHPPASFTAHMWPASTLCAAAACSRAYIAWLARALHSPHLGFHTYLSASFNVYVYTRSASAPPDVLTPEQDRLFIPGACTQAHICAAVSVPPARPARVAAVTASM
jgi:hypothetical protein